MTKLHRSLLEWYRSDSYKRTIFYKFYSILITKFSLFRRIHRVGRCCVFQLNSFFFFVLKKLIKIFFSSSYYYCVFSSLIKITQNRHFQNAFRVYNCPQPNLTSQTLVGLTDIIHQAGLVFAFFSAIILIDHHFDDIPLKIFE